MDHPDVWFLLGQHMHQDFLTVHGDLCDGVRHFLQDITTTQRQDLINHLDHLIGGGFSPNELANAWWATEAAIIPSREEEMPEFLAHIRACAVAP